MAERKAWKKVPTKKQTKFIEEYVESGNGTQSALKAYDTDDYNTAKAIASENLSKPYIEAEIDKRLKDAKAMIYSLSQEAKKEEVRLRASQDIVDRVEGRALQKIQQDTTLSVDVENADWETLIKVAKGLK